MIEETPPARTTGGRNPDSQPEDYCRRLCDALFERCSRYVSGTERVSAHSNIVLVPPAFQVEPHHTADHPAPLYYRWQARTSSTTLSVRTGACAIEFFILPTLEAKMLSISENELRRVGTVELVQSESGFAWLLDGSAISPDELRLFLRSCLGLLAGDTPAGEANERQTAHAAGTFDRASAAQVLPGQQNVGWHNSSIAVQNLIYRLISQQDATKAWLARELHDTVIADLMMLKRFLLGDRKLSEQEIIEHIDDVVRCLRDICNDFSPRNLKDWELKTSLEALVEQTEQRSGIQCSLVCAGDLPDLEDSVQLHIYRIAQEALNNVEKYAGASRAVIELRRQDATFTLSICDNGRGFDPLEFAEHVATDSGMGPGSMRERAALIRCLHPAEFSVESSPGSGTRVRLILELQS